MLTSTIQAELSAINAYHDAQERVIKELTKEVHTETPTFNFVELVKEVEISFNFDGWFLKEFTRKNRPESAKHIYSIQKNKFGDYTVRYRSIMSNTPEIIRRELAQFMLPF